MFDPRLKSHCSATRAETLHRQQLALDGRIHMFEITTAVVGDNASFFKRGSVVVATVQEALDMLPFATPTEATVDFMSSCFFAENLIPVADPRATEVTWPTIIIPSEDELAFFCNTEDDEARVLEVLLTWRSHVDHYASTRPCDSAGWVGGVWIPHPDCRAGEEVSMCMCWPWIHRPYGVEARPGDPRLFDLFNVSVDCR